jgi:arsenite methyltransferase
MSANFTKAISLRYDKLSAQQCCLSCGGAIQYLHIQSGFHCADLGSGKGIDAIKMAELAGPSGYVWGIDISQKMIATALENVHKQNLSNISFIECKLEDIALDNNSLDIILSNCTINHSLDQSRVWQEIFRILKPGGMFCISDIYATDEIPENFRNDPDALAQCWAGAVTKHKYLENIRNAGFPQIEIIEESAPYEKGQVTICSFTIRGTKP